jgi:fructose 1,6-bisphosphatase
MKTISEQKEVKAVKEHRCNLCGSKISIGDTYMTSTHKSDGDIYAWKTHKHCSEIADRLKMYEECDEGLTGDDFQETIHGEYFDLMLNKFTKEDVAKYSDVLQQLRNVRFNDKLWYVIRHYNKIDKQLLNESK